MLGPAGDEPVTTPVEPPPVEPPPVDVVTVTVASGSPGVVTPTEGELGGGAGEPEIVPPLVDGSEIVVDESSGVTVSDEMSGGVLLEIVPSSGVDCGVGSSRADCSERDGVPSAARNVP
jgi:hypothetical protein